MKNVVHLEEKYDLLQLVSKWEIVIWWSLILSNYGGNALVLKVEFCTFKNREHRATVLKSAGWIINDRETSVSMLQEATSLC